jgi:F-type H+-transporting ATPase subunit alpha
MEEQVAALFAGVNGYLDDVPVSQAPRFQDELREHLRSEEAIYAEIGERKELSDELTERMHAEIRRFKETFAVRDEPAIAGAAA